MELNNPFLEKLGVTLISWRDGFVELRLLPDEAHGNRTGIVQGGVIATLLDAGCGYAGLFSGSDAEQSHAITISLSINYVAAAKLLEPLVVTGEVVGQGRSVYFSRGEVRNQNRALIASAQGAFKRRK